MIMPGPVVTYADGKYDTEFKEGKGSSELASILQSVKKVNTYVQYRTYVFSNESRITLNSLGQGSLTDKAVASLITNEAASGTALLIKSSDMRIALLTCAHVVDLPDTVISWSEYSDLQSNKYIHSISIKEKQRLYVRDVPQSNDYVLLASDQKKDLAIIGCKLSGENIRYPEIFPYPIGNSDLLQWGSSVILAGFPASQLMITRGIVSLSPDPDAGFLTDAPFNEGFSGGIALAVMDGVPNFELVGIGKSVSARTEYFLKPEKENYEFAYNPSVPYSGSVYVNQKKDINYGVTWIVPINKVIQFYTENRNSLIGEGYNMDEVFLNKRIR